MTKKITTRKVGKNFAEADWVLLEQTANTALIFKPEIHPGGVRGFLVRVKKDASIDWDALKVGDFEKKSLDPKTRLEIELPTSALRRLLDAAEEHGRIVGMGIKNGKQEYIVAEKSKVVVVDDETKRAIFESLLAKGYSTEFWQKLSESEPELASKLSAGHIFSEKFKTLRELTKRLTEKHSETTGPTSWQKWIYANNWLFGINHIRAIEKAKISISGSMPDYLFLTPDHFVDVLEIKLPEEEVIMEDTHHAGSYKWSPKTNEAIGQVVNYLSQIERFQDALEKEILRVYELNVSFVKPRGFILIGRKDGWNSFKLGALRNLNFALHGIEVLTYDDLLKRGAQIAGMYKNESEEEMA